MYDLVKTFHFSKSNATKIYNALRSSTSSLSSASSLAGTAPVLALISVGAGTITRQLKKGKTAFVNW